jgi:hypothetical protein
MILFGIACIIVCSRLPGRESIRVYGETEKKRLSKEEAAAVRNKRRKLRKKLK